MIFAFYTKFLTFTLGASFVNSMATPEMSCAEIGQPTYKEYTIKCRTQNTNQGPFLHSIPNLTDFTACAEECSVRPECSTFNIFKPSPGTPGCYLYKAPILGVPTFTSSSYWDNGYKNDPAEKSCKQINSTTYDGYTLRCLSQNINQGPYLMSFPDITAFTTCAKECSARRACSTFNIFKPSPGSPGCYLYKAPLMGTPKFTSSSYWSNGYKNDPAEKSCEQVNSTTYKEYTIRCKTQNTNQGQFLEFFSNISAFTACAEECSARQACSTFNIFQPATGTPGCYLFHAPTLGTPKFVGSPYWSNGYKNEPAEKSCEQVNSTTYYEYAVRCGASLSNTGLLLESMQSKSFTGCAGECSARATCVGFIVFITSSNIPTCHLYAALSNSGLPSFATNPTAAAGVKTDQGSSTSVTSAVATPTESCSCYATEYF